MAGNLTASGGDTCGITGEICKANVDHVYCSPPPGVSCNITCPEFDAGRGYSLISADYGADTIYCEYGIAPGGIPRTTCSYWPVWGFAATFRNDFDAHEAVRIRVRK